ncbi:MAG: DEAD/DEAH box helicase family protein, partial [Phycisphaerales bacterium]|nr:DEAD/DEAH box helicase family protein [Phycisphaerales bacterium]
MPTDPTRLQVVSDFSPAGDQPDAIDAIVHGFQNGQRQQCLLGATGTGKTFTMAHTIARVN